MPTTRSKSKSKGGKKEESWCDRLSVKQDSPGVRTAKFFGPQAIEDHHNLTVRRQKEANPRPQGSEGARQAAMRMADLASEKPMPTSRPQTVNGITKSTTIMNEHRDYRAWRASLEQEAIDEVKKDLKKEGLSSKLVERRFKLECPKPTGGVEGDWRPALW